MCSLRIKIYTYPKNIIKITIIKIRIIKIRIVKINIIKIRIIKIRIIKIRIIKIRIIKIRIVTEEMFLQQKLSSRKYRRSKAEIEPPSGLPQGPSYFKCNTPLSRHEERGGSAMYRSEERRVGKEC